MASPLVVNILELTRRPGTDKDLVVAVPATILSLDDPRVADDQDVDVDIHLESVSGGIVVTGTAVAEAHLSCRRCLTEFEMELSGEIDELYQRIPDNPDATALTSEQLDLTSVVREGVLLAVPDAPLCRPDCPGLCPQCGADLAKAPCGCNAVKKDDRWAALDALRDQLPPG